MNPTLRTAIEAVINSEDSTGCSDDLTVVSAKAVRRLRRLLDTNDVAAPELEPNAPELEPTAPVEHPSICVVNPDDAHYIGTHPDGVFFDVKSGPGGWYMSALVASDQEREQHWRLVSDMGPFPSLGDAWEAGHATAIQWCEKHDIEPNEDDED